MTSVKETVEKYAGGVIVPLLVVLAGLLAYFILLPKYKDVRAARDVVSHKKTVVVSREEVLTNIQSLIAEYEGKKEALQPIDESLPTAPRIPELLANLDQLARNGGMRLAGLEIALAPTLSTAASGLAVGEVRKTEELLTSTENITVMQINLKLVGSYPGLLSWLSNLEQNLRLLDVKLILADEVEEKTGAQEFNLKIHAYYQRDAEQ